MKRYKGLIKTVTLSALALFVANMALMYIIFGVNVLNPGKSDSSLGFLAGTASPADTGAGAAAAGAGGAAAGDAAEAQAAGSDAGAAGGAGLAGTAEADAWGVPGAEAGDPDASFMSASEVECLGGLSIADKIAALSLIKKIGGDEANRIYDMAGDGLTYRELGEIKASLEEYLTRDDLQLLYDLLEKGKKLYADSSR